MPAGLPVRILIPFVIKVPEPQSSRLSVQPVCKFGGLPVDQAPPGEVFSVPCGHVGEQHLPG